MAETLGFIGLGKLGLPIAEKLMAAGYALRVWNRTAEKAAPLIARGAAAVKSATESVVAGGIVLSVVADDRALLEVASDDFCKALATGIHISMSTVSPVTSRTLAERHTRFGGQFVAAPVFGR